MIKVIRYDVIGNDERGYEVNDLYTVGNINREDYDPIETLLDYFGGNAVIANDAFGGNREEVINITNGKPLGALIFND